MLFIGILSFIGMGTSHVCYWNEPIPWIGFHVAHPDQ